MRASAQDVPAGLLCPAAVLALALLHVALLAPWVSGSHPSDDTLLLVPAFLSGVEGRPILDTFAYLLAPNQPDMPRAPWKAYVLGTHWLLGSGHAGLVWVGVGLHVATSLLVGGLSRQIGLGRGATWGAVGLHFTAYAGFHAYVWPVGIQHVLTIGGILALLNLYLATDRRWRAGRPYRSLFWITTGVALLSSLSRASSAVGPVAILIHALVSPGTCRERLNRYDLWRLPMLLSLVYPIALAAFGNDQESLSGIPFVAATLRLVFWRLGPSAAFASMLGGALIVLLLVRFGLSRVGRGGAERSIEAPRWIRGALWLALAALAAPAVVKLAIVFVWGAQLFLAPLGLALNSHNTDRRYVATLPLDLAGVALGVILLTLFVREYRRESGLLVLLVLYGAFASAYHATEPQPLRYWIYVTPALAIVLAAAGDAGYHHVAEKFSLSARWTDAVLAVVWAIVMLMNVAAIQLEMWRHRMADSYQVLDYLRTAHLIRRDLDSLHAAPDTPVCVDGLEPLPHQDGWTLLFAAPFRDYNARSILAQELGKEARLVGLDCPTSDAPAYRYTVRGAVVVRDGQSIDPFDRLHTHLRGLVAAGDYRAARELIGDRARLRPFVIQHLLGDLPDDDVSWATNGASLLVWLDRIADNHDHWYGIADAKIQALRDMTAHEVGAYVRLLFLVEHLDETPPGDPARRRRLPFGGLPLRDVQALIQSDPLLAGLTGTPIVLERVGEPRTAADLALVAFLGRLLPSALRGSRRPP